jgi:predicted transcriptional regulator
MPYRIREVSLMTRVTIKVTDEIHEKLRWLCYKQRRSQQVIVEEILKRALAKVDVPKEERRSKV